MLMTIQKLQQMRQNDPASEQQAGEALHHYFQLAEDFKTMMCRCECKPHFVGVWDTVSSVGWKDSPLKLPYVTDNPDIAIGRHAISIDERRAFFRSHRWIHSTTAQEHGPVDVKQVWFAGVHCDVGGGYPEQESGLSKIALEWMLEEAKAAGLYVRPERQQEVMGLTPDSRYAKANADACAHESLEGWWKLAEWISKPHYDYATGRKEMRRNRGRRRTIPPDALIHESVFQRHGGNYAKALNLPPTIQKVATRSGKTVLPAGPSEAKATGPNLSS
jgi:uncharacterized protein (DUF2235 family)